MLTKFAVPDFRFEKGGHCQLAPQLFGANDIVTKEILVTVTVTDLVRISRVNSKSM